MDQHRRAKSKRTTRWREQDIHGVAAGRGQERDGEGDPETTLLTHDEKIMGRLLSKAAGADYVKTSTGFAGAAARRSRRSSCARPSVPRWGGRHRVVMHARRRREDGGGGATRPELRPA